MNLRLDHARALKAEHVPEAVGAVPKDRVVYRAGKEVARGGALTS